MLKIWFQNRSQSRNHNISSVHSLASVLNFFGTVNGTSFFMEQRAQWSFGMIIIWRRLWHKGVKPLHLSPVTVAASICTKKLWTVGGKTLWSVLPLTRVHSSFQEHVASVTEFLALKHESRILGHSSNPVCGFSIMEQVRLCAVWPMETWLGSSLNQIQGWTMSDSSKHATSHIVWNTRLCWSAL